MKANLSNNKILLIIISLFLLYISHAIPGAANDTVKGPAVSADKKAASDTVSPAGKNLTGNTVAPADKIVSPGPAESKENTGPADTLKPDTPEESTGISDMEMAEAVSDEIEQEGSTLFSTVKKGGPLMIFIVLLGIVSMTIIIERLIFFSRNSIWKSDTVEKFLNEVALESMAEYREDLEDELGNAFRLYSNGMERGLALLSGIGNIAPIVGFLGTVIGMISAFASIAAATTVNAKVVAVGIQIALVTTAGGLMVAAPTLAFFYLFTHVIQNRYADAEEVINQACADRSRLSNLLGPGEVSDG